MDPSFKISSTLRKLVVWWIAPDRLPTIARIEQLEELYVNFSGKRGIDDEPEPYLAARPVADLRQLPRLREITLSSGFEADCGPRRINCTFAGISHSVATMAFEANMPPHARLDFGWDLYDCLGTRPLQRLLPRFPSLRHLSVLNIGSQELAGVELPLLETLETMWCSPGTTRGMVLPALRHLSLVSTVEAGQQPLQDVSPHLDGLQTAYICLERDTYIPDHTVLDLSAFYEDYRQHSGWTACLIEGDVSAPPGPLDGLRYLPSARITGASVDRQQVLQQHEKRREIKTELGIDGRFRDPGDQEFGAKPSLPDPNGFYFQHLRG